MQSEVDLRGGPPRPVGRSDSFLAHIMRRRRSESGVHLSIGCGRRAAQGEIRVTRSIRPATPAGGGDFRPLKRDARRGRITPHWCLGLRPCQGVLQRAPTGRRVPATIPLALLSAQEPANPCVFHSSPKRSSIRAFARGVSRNPGPPAVISACLRPRGPDKARLCRSAR